MIFRCGCAMRMHISHQAHLIGTTGGIYRDQTECYSHAALMRDTRLAEPLWDICAKLTGLDLGPGVGELLGCAKQTDLNWDEWLTRLVRNAM